MARSVIAAVGGMMLAGALLTACVADAAPDPTPTPTATESAQASPGSRDNPLPVGEMMPLADDSAWSVGASDVTQVGDGYVVLPLRIRIDWDAIRAQLAEAGEDPAAADALGIDPWASLIVRFVAADGRSYELLESATANVPDQLWEVGTVYPPADDLAVNVVVTVPADQVDGGVWTIVNTGGDVVFVSTGLDEPVE